MPPRAAPAEMTTGNKNSSIQLSLGDTSCYILSTAQPELGVVVAKSEEGKVNMLPLSHRQMQCPVTSRKESRKVARIKPEYIEFIEK